MVTGAKRIYLDTNVLAYVANTKAPQHRAALEVFRPTETETLCVSSQVLAEFYSYITNPTILANPLQPADAMFRIQRICQMSHVYVLPTPVDLFDRWFGLLADRPVTNGGIFDLLHIGIMLAHQINTIYTFNVKDFAWCSRIVAIDPESC